MLFKFPKNFKLGVADADLQVIGEDFTQKFEESQPTIWEYFAKHSPRVYKHHTPGISINRYQLWQNDIEEMKKMGVKHYRTSVSLARILKENGEINQKAIDWYREYFKNLKNAGITVYVSLYHWELPQALQEKGGWENPDTTKFFIKHAKTVVEYLNDYIEEYFIINEPWCIAVKGNYQGGHAPGNTDLKKALKAAHNVMITIGLTFKELIKSNPSLKIGTVFNSESYYAASTDPEDVLAAKLGDGHFNRWFTDPLFLGKYPEDMVDFYGKNMPYIRKDDMKIIKVGDKMYSFGQNNYCGKVVEYDGNSPLKFKDVFIKGGLKNDLGWPITVPPHYPEGLYDMISKIYYSYKDHGLKRIYITENGMAEKSKPDKSGKVNDIRRIAYLKEHLRQIHKAITRGIPVEGYFEWTLMDNYEWEEGYKDEGRFGIIYVDKDSMKRIWKKSAHWYKKLLDTSIIPE